MSAKTIKFKTRTFISPYRIKVGDLIRISYHNNSDRYVVVIAPKYKRQVYNCEGYEFESLKEIPLELLSWILDNKSLKSGDLYERFKNSYKFKSYTLTKMKMTWIVPFEYDVTNKQKIKGEVSPKLIAGEIIKGDYTEKGIYA